jgi:hypothetical protein
MSFSAEPLARSLFLMTSIHIMIPPYAALSNLRPPAVIGGDHKRRGCCIPNHVFGSPTFWQVLSANASGNKPPRQIQLGLKYIF